MARDTSPRRLFEGDLTVWIVYFILCAISLVEVYSAASSLTYGHDSFLGPLIKQLCFVLGGTLVVIFTQHVPPRYFRVLGLVGWMVSIVLLLVTLVSGHNANGAARWLSLFGFQIQPSEVAKGMTILLVSIILTYSARVKDGDKMAFWSIFCTGGLTCLLIVSENLSTAVILFLTIALLMYISGLNRKYLTRLFLAIGIVGALGFLALKSLPADESADIYKVGAFHRALTWRNRVAGDEAPRPQDPHEFVITDKNRQEVNALIAVSSTTGIGKMPGNSVQRDFLSQPYSDFIFAIIAEEMGLWGTFLVAFLYAILLFRAGRIASGCNKNFPAFAVLGLTLMMVLQACVNMAVAVGLFPVTGQTLPIISRGGSSLLITCLYFGIILSVSRDQKQQKKTSSATPKAVSAAPVRSAEPELQVAEMVTPAATTED